MERNTKLVPQPRASEILLEQKTQLYDDVKTGLVTPPVKIGKRAVAWPEHELHAINAAKIAGKTEAEIKTLVQRLVKERAQLADRVAA